MNVKIELKNLLYLLDNREKYNPPISLEKILRRVIELLLEVK